MKYVDEYRDGALGHQMIDALSQEVRPGQAYAFMEFCGGHTHALFRHGLVDRLPAAVRMIHGPGCPVCVLPVGRIDNAIELARRDSVTLCTYGDMLRVPGSGRLSLLQAKAQGADVRMVYSSTDALRLAQQHPDREVVFFAIGFETTTLPTAVVLQQARKLGLGNFSVFCNHVLTPPAAHALLESLEATADSVQLDGLVGPGHVSTIIGSGAFEPFVARFRRPVVIAGFEPLDLLHAIRLLVRQVNEGRAEVVNEYPRAVTRAGNLKAQSLMTQCFELRSTFEWRGLGQIPNSALRIRDAFADLDAERRYELTEHTGRDNPACACGDVLRGAKEPRDCTLFGSVCTPGNPMGACMVSSEGACAAYYTYGRGHLTPSPVTPT